jgi:predicted dehydrogenase
MPAGPVGVGVIGAGTISTAYLANMTSFPDLAVRFVADLVPERAAQQAAAYGVAGSGTVGELLARDDVEIAVNLTIPAAHAEVGAAALAAGKHLWNEKPLAADRKSAAALLSQAEEAGLLVGCAPDTVLGPGLQAARRMIERGDIGRPLTAAAVMQYPGPHAWHPNPDFLYQAGGGPLFDMAPYYLTALTQLFGPITRVAARGSSASPTRVIGTGPRAGQSFDVTVPTYIAAVYDFAAGQIAQLTLSFDSPLVRIGVVEVAGTEATLATPDPNTFLGDVRIARTGEERWETVPVTGVEGGRGIGVLDMARALRTGAQHRATGRLGLHVLDAMFATATSIAEDRFVTVDSAYEAIPPMPADFDPTARTLP